MIFLPTRNHTYKSFTPKPQKKQSQTPEASSAFNNTRRLFHIKPITHHHVICIFDFLLFYSPASPSPLLICYICFFLILYINIVFHASVPIKRTKSEQMSSEKRSALLSIKYPLVNTYVDILRAHPLRIEVTHRLHRFSHLRRRSPIYRHLHRIWTSC